MTTSSMRRRVSTLSTGEIAVTVRKALRRPQFWFGIFVFVPTVIWFFIFSYRPILLAFRMSVVDYRLLDPAHSPWMGLKNFQTLLAHDLLWTSAGNTIKYALLVNLGMLPVAMILAYCLVNIIRGRNFYQWAIFIPVVVSVVAVGLLFIMLMDPNKGILNYALKSLGLPTSKWLTGKSSAMLTIAAIDIWKGMGVNIVLLTAGLLNIPQEMYDAAKVDGANAWQVFWKVTIPLLSYTLTFVMVIVAVGSLQVYTSALILTGGGPAHATYMINMYIVDEAFTNLRFGTATAASLFLFAAIMVITLVQIRLFRTRWQY